MKLSNPTNPLPESADLYVDLPTNVSDGQVEFGCRLVSASMEVRRIWFRFPREAAPMLSRRADPFVLATLVHAIEHLSRVHVHGTVSEGLLANLGDFQAAYSAIRRRPLFAPVEYSSSQTAPAAEDVRAGKGITAFSGGVDSCFSVFRHTALGGDASSRPIGAALMMHGFDIPLATPDVFERSAAQSRVMAEDAGVVLFTGATNLRTLPVAWDDSFATAVAASLSFFQPAYGFGLIPSFQDWAHVNLASGSNPLTDPLLSSLSFQVIHDGTGFGRIDKLRQLKKWPVAMRHLRVCWEGEKLDRNCCRCEKCLRTMLMLRVCGVGQPAAFPLPIDLAQLNRLIIRNQSGLDEFAYLLEEARRIGLDEPWIKPAARALRRNRRSQRLWRRGKALAGAIPAGVRSIVRDACHRWLWQSPAPRVDEIAAL